MTQRTPTTAGTEAPSQLSRSARLVRASGAMVLFALPVALLGFAARQQFDPMIRFDERVIRSVTDFTRENGLGPALIAVQEGFQPYLLYIVATSVAAWAWLVKGLRARALWAFVTMMVSWNVGLLVKLLVARARPVVDEPISHSPGYSFPSGHAFNAAVVATVLVFLLWPLLSAVGRRVATALAVVFALVVGLDRMFLGVHFPSDVFAGFVLGVGITFSSWLGFIGKTHGTSSHGPSHPA
jgi:membrane-associated phospholipid phosphatase